MVGGKANEAILVGMGIAESESNRIRILNDSEFFFDTADSKFKKASPIRRKCVANSENFYSINMLAHLVWHALIALIHMQ